MARDLQRHAPSHPGAVRLIKLTLYDDTPVYINPAHLICVRRVRAHEVSAEAAADMTKLVMVGENLTVKESVVYVVSEAEAL